MDGAADRVDLRGLRLLERSRTLRRDDAQGHLARMRDALGTALQDEAQASARLDEHRANWRAREAASLAEMQGRTVGGQRFRDRRDGIEQMADRGILLRQVLDEAGAAVEAARHRMEASRIRLAERQRRLQQNQAITSRVQTMRAAAVEAAEEQELEDDLLQRHGRAGRRR